MDPSTTQCAGVFPDATTHRGRFSAIADTGSPLAELGIAVPTVSAVQSVSEIVLFPSMVASCAAATIQAELIKRRTMAIVF